MSAGRDLIIVGAGPAGLAAAARAAEGGARVLLLDDQPAPGGQIWRGVGGAPGAGDDVLGAEYAAGRAALARLERAGVARAAGATVWQVTAEGEVGWSAEGRSRLVRAPFVLLATGAMERPMPVPGWTLPGVMTAGGAQTLLKSAALAAEGAVFAGCGPLLYLVVAQYLRAGVPVAAVLDTTAPAGRLDALAHLPGALLRADLLLKGQRWLGEIRRSGTRVIRGVTDLRILGTERAEGIAYQRDRGAWERIAAAHVFLHQGVVPNPNLAMAAGIAQVWDDTQLCWRPRTDRWGRSSALGLFVAGDG
ncbi:MAG: FAD-dependent oxidoreductase, partial [Pseudomonadota bacterium]